MKYLIFILVLTSCGSNKEGIVKQIQDTKTEFNLARNWESTYDLLKSDIETYGKPTNVDARFLKDIPEYMIKENRIDSARIAWQVRKIELRNKIDSLELELKKY